MRQLEEDSRQLALSTQGAVVSIGPERNVCPCCAGPTGVQKTRRHRVVTLQHGPFTAHETVLICQQQCTDGAGRLATLRSEELRGRVRPGAVYGYDIEVYVGLERYLHHRQRAEISDALAKQGIFLSTGQISLLGHRFVAHLEQLHWQRAPALKEALASDGGYPLHIDATGEDGRGTLYLAYSGWRRWVLGSWKLSTERAELILPCLRYVVQAFGMPCSLMRDLGRAAIKAATDLRSELSADFPILGCHQHFLGDIGEDLLEASHDQLRELVRRFGLKSGLRTLARNLGQRLGSQLVALRSDIAHWADAGTDHVLPTGATGVAVVRALAQWALDYAQDGTYGSFPFDRPYLDFYNRCHKVRRSVDAFLRTPPQDAVVRRALERLASTLDPVVAEPKFATTAATLSRRAELFDELRDALRLTPRRNSTTPSAGEPAVEASVAELQDIQQALKTLTESLRQRRPERGPAQDQRKAIDMILQHIDRHGESLWGHAIALTGVQEGKVRVVARTNNDLEAFNHQMKHGERRRSGRKILTQDFEALPAGAAVVYNLADPDYVQLLCGSLSDLPRAFAEIDRVTRMDPHHSRDPVEPIVTASVPRQDRPMVRAKFLRRRIEAAARSRAPHYETPTSNRRNRVLTL